MGTVLGLLGLAVAAVIVTALAIVAVRTVGPFVDGSTLFRGGSGNAPPVGMQEEEPHRWDFSAMGTGEPTEQTHAQGAQPAVGDGRPGASGDGRSPQAHEQD